MRDAPETLSRTSPFQQANDPQTLSILGTVSVPGYSSKGFVFSRSGEEVYIGTGTEINGVNTSTLLLTKTIPLPYSERSIALSNSGEALLLTPTSRQDGGDDLSPDT